MASDVREIQASAPVSTLNGNGYDVGRRAEVVENFPWRPDGEGKAPVFMQVRPHALSSIEVDNLDLEIGEAQANQEELKTLKGKLRELETKAFLEDDDETALLTEDEQGEEYKKRRAKIAAIKDKVAALEALPSPVRLIAEKLICRVVKSWPLMIEGKTVKLEVADVMRIDPLTLRFLRDD